MNVSKRAQPLNREVRSYGISDVDLRTEDAGDALTFTGEASVVEHPYTVHDMFGEFTETVRDGAFDKTLSENPDVVFLVNHEGLPLARTTSGTLRLSTSPNLKIGASLEPSDPDVQRIDPKIRRGDLNEMSFAFRVTRQSWNEDYTERDILEVNLHRGDVSVVTYGASPTTTASLRFDGVDVGEFVAAVDAMKGGDATDAQMAIVARAASMLVDLTTPDADIEKAAAEELARIAATRADVADRFQDVQRQLVAAAEFIAA